MATIGPLRRVIACPRCHFHPVGEAPPLTSLRVPIRASPRSSSLPQTRQICSTPPRHEENIDTERAERPRWQQTPRGMAMPVRVRLKPKNQEWTSNSDVRKLDAMYVQLLGKDGDKLLSEEVKWLAITHKSFDQGRRGFNDRLSYLGKRIVDLQTSMALTSSAKSPLEQQGADEFGRTPFNHPALDGLNNLSERTKGEILNKGRLARLAQSHNLDGVIRWQPRKVENLLGSGLEVVLAQAVYAIVGALSLERGGEVATRLTRERILRPLGVVS